MAAGVLLTPPVCAPTAAYNVLSLYVFQHGSSVLFVVANAVRLPLVDALNSVRFVSGQATEAFGKYDAFALIPLVLAIFVYYSEPEMDDIKKRELERAAAVARGNRTFSGGAYNITVVSPRVAGAPFRNRYASQEHNAIVRVGGCGCACACALSLTPWCDVFVLSEPRRQ